MEFEIVSKGVEVVIKDKATGAAIKNLYVGAGWDFVDGPVDLDLVGACLSGGKLTAQTRLVYFGDKTEPGVTLGADNRSGEGAGDDESMVIDLTKVESDVDSIALGLVAYSNTTLKAVRNVHFRIVDGTQPTDKQVFDVKMENAGEADTVLHAATLKKGADGVWSVENVSKFYAASNGGGAVSAFAKLFA